MKRKLVTAVTAAACAVTCAFGLAACGGSHTHDYGTEWQKDATYHWHECTASGDCDAKEKDKAEHSDADNDGKCDVCEYAMPSAVTAGQWTQIMNDTTNFTVEGSANNMVNAIKIDGAIFSVELENAEGELRGESICVKDGDNYYGYELNVENSTWTRSTITSDAYEMYKNTYASFLTFFKDDYSSFTYADGKYTAASLDKTSTMNTTITNVEVTFMNGALTGLTFSISDDDVTINYEVKNVGTTAITLPENYTPAAE